MGAFCACRDSRKIRIIRKFIVSPRNLIIFLFKIQFSTLKFELKFNQCVVNKETDLQLFTLPAIIVPSNVDMIRFLTPIQPGFTSTGVPNSSYPLYLMQIIEIIELLHFRVYNFYCISAYN